MITKFVLPVAGRGKRLMPLTLNTPKALVPMGGMPLVEYAIKEGWDAGIREFIFVASPDHVPQLAEYYRGAEGRFPGAQFSVRVQENPHGNGHAILQAADRIENEPFVVRFPDDVMFGEFSLASFIAHFEKQHSPMVLLERVPWERASQYGIVDAESAGTGGIHRIKGVIEKPKEPPSNLSIVGGYILTPDIIHELRNLEAGAMEFSDDSLLLTDAFRQHLAKGGSLYGWEFSGVRHDCGNLEGLKKAEEFLSQNSIPPKN